MAVVADHLSRMAHEGTKDTKDAPRCRVGSCWMGLLLNLNTDRLEHGLRRHLHG
jgi:hypothetical protein